MTTPHPTPPTPRVSRPRWMRPLPRFARVLTSANVRARSHVIGTRCAPAFGDKTALTFLPTAKPESDRLLQKVADMHAAIAQHIAAFPHFLEPGLDVGAGVLGSHVLTHKPETSRAWRSSLNHPSDSNARRFTRNRALLAPSFCSVGCDLSIRQTRAVEGRRPSGIIARHAPPSLWTPFRPHPDL